MIYVHNAPEGLEFNAIVYCLMRAWHLPDIPNIVPEDQWFSVPAVKIGPIYNMVNSNFNLTALMMIDADGRVVKSHRVNLNIAPRVEGFELEELKRQSFDIPLWEETNQQEFPYATMFDPARISQRYAETNPIDNSAVYSGASTNTVYNQIRERIQPRPCNCGKGSTT